MKLRNRETVLSMLPVKLELLSLTDRMYVMYNGTVMAELETKTTEDEIMYYSVGGKDNRTGNNRQEGYGSDEKSYEY